MESRLKITTPIREILLSDPAIVEMVGGKIFPIVAPKDTLGDFIIYQRDGFSTADTKMGMYKQAPTVFINAISDDYDRSQTLADLIYTRLEGKFSNPSMHIRLIDSTEDFEDNKYMQILLFEIQ